ncbi:MAG: TfoX/Sxy family protein [Melioribacteraceae bacterium]
MAFDELLGGRVRQILFDKNIKFEEKKMMGGLSFMVDSKICVGIIKDELVARVGPDKYEDSLNREGCREMNFTGRSMKGYVFVDSEVLNSSKDIGYWVQLCLDFNPFAKSSKKKKE